MTRIIKTISLDQETDRIAKLIPNFSAWIRAKLIQFDEDMNPKIKYSYACYKCDRVFTFDKDQGEQTYCRNNVCKHYGHYIDRYTI